MNLAKSLTPYPSVLDFEQSSLTNWILTYKNQFWNGVFAGYKGSKNPVQNRLKIQFVELDFCNLIFQKTCTDG